ASDIYALGVVMYEALAGRKPFSGDTPIAMAYNIQHGKPVPLSELRAGLDPRLVAVIERAMARDPAQRYASAGAMAAALHAAPSVPSAGADATAVVAPIADPTSVMSRSTPATGTTGTTGTPVDGSTTSAPWAAGAPMQPKRRRYGVAWALAI